MNTINIYTLHDCELAVNHHFSRFVRYSSKLPVFPSFSSDRPHLFERRRRPAQAPPFFIKNYNSRKISSCGFQNGSDEYSLSLQTNGVFTHPLGEKTPPPPFDFFRIAALRFENSPSPACAPSIPLFSIFPFSIFPFSILPLKRRNRDV